MTEWFSTYDVPEKDIKGIWPEEGETVAVYFKYTGFCLMTMKYVSFDEDRPDIKDPCFVSKSGWLGDEWCLWSRDLLLAFQDPEPDIPDWYFKESN